MRHGGRLSLDRVYGALYRVGRERYDAPPIQYVSHPEP